MVGSIRITSREGDSAKKYVFSHICAALIAFRGDEHGYFAFGGSTILVLFEPDRIVFDKDLVVNSEKPIEVLCLVGVKQDLTSFYDNRH